MWKMTQKKTIRTCRMGILIRRVETTREEKMRTKKKKKQT